jgi:diguanylate cyclase (GGDEF)-like protein
VLLPETDREHASVVAERLLHAVRDADIRTDAGDTLKITVSIGLATLTTQVPDIRTLLQHADEALYDAKAEGRNRCCVFEAAA